MNAFVKTKIILPTLFISSSFSIADASSNRIDLPDKQYSVEIVRPDPNSADATMVVRQGSKTLAALPTIGFLPEAYKSTDGKYLGINNRRANSGDYLWVLELPSGKVLKNPDDEKGKSWRGAAAASFHKADPAATEETFIRDWLTTTGWNGNQLKISVRAAYRVSEKNCRFEATINPANWTLTNVKGPDRESSEAQSTVVADAAPKPPDEREFEAAKLQYEQALPPGNEAARLTYVNKLAQIIDRNVVERWKTGRPNPDWFKLADAIHSELKKHPVPKDSDPKKLSQLLVGQWQSPRHIYIFRRDGKYGVEDGGMDTDWRIQGNQIVMPSSRSTIIVLNAEYLIYTERDTVYFFSRVKE